jgi:hypothetical protein
VCISWTNKEFEIVNAWCNYEDYWNSLRQPPFLVTFMWKTPIEILMNNGRTVQSLTPRHIQSRDGRTWSTHTHTHTHLEKNACYSRSCTRHYELTTACLYSHCCTRHYELISTSSSPSYRFGPFSDAQAQFRYGFRFLWPSPQSVTILFCPQSLHIRTSCLFRTVLRPYCTLILLSSKIPRTKHVMLFACKSFPFMFNHRKEYKFEASQL